MSFLLRAAVLLAALTMVMGAACAPKRGPDRRPKFSALRELSGLALTEDRQRLYGVSDEGRLIEFESDGRILRDAYFSDDDLEGLTRAPNGELWLLEERRSRIYRIDPVSFEKKGEFRVKPHPGRKDKNSGYEGVQFDEDGRLWLINQKPAVLVCFEVEDFRARRLEAITLPVDNANDFLVLSKNQGFVVLSKDEGLRLFDRRGLALGDWFPLTDEPFEGLVLMPGKGLHLCADDQPSSIIVLDDIIDEASLIELLKRKE